MAKQKTDEMADEQWQFDQDLPNEVGEEGQSRKVEYPGGIARTSSREELMECIKRGQRPAWIPRPGFQALRDEEEARNAQRRPTAGALLSDEIAQHPAMLAGASGKEDSRATVGIEKGEEPSETPRSALHRGNFSEHPPDAVSDFWANPGYQPGIAISTSNNTNAPPLGWHPSSSRHASLDAVSHVRAFNQLDTHFASRRRAPSLGSSLSSIFVLRAPTSPLVHSTSNLETSSGTRARELGIPQRDHTRRRTMPPNSFQAFTMTPIDATPPNFSRPFVPTSSREGSMPSPTYPHRRSLSSLTYHPRSNPQTPVARNRRPSTTSEGASRRRTSMVGSFEESLLTGRMSTPPSKPFDFVAQIGVMGKGDCPASLKCPAHVHIPFPAVFYSYPASSGIRTVSDDTPSPYVGSINLDRNLKPVTLAAKSSKKGASKSFVHDNQSTLSNVGVVQDSEPESSKIHVGGAYRVPQKGQLQIILKNPNKTAVKLFIVPYDLTGMEPGTKTFIRQKSFSTGSIIDEAVADNSEKSADTDPLRNKHILRYLVHLRFCCPAKARFYLFDDIRVVFANRVPDGKEKLRIEVQRPEPNFSTWKPSKAEASSHPLKRALSTPVADTFEFESPQSFGDIEGIPFSDSPASPTPSQRLPATTPPFEFPNRSSLIGSATWNSSLSDAENERSSYEFLEVKHGSNTPSATICSERAVSPVTGFGATTPLRSSPIPWRPTSASNGQNRSFSPVPFESKDGLLTKQFKELRKGVLPPKPAEHDIWYRNSAH